MRALHLVSVPLAWACLTFGCARNPAQQLDGGADLSVVGPDGGGPDGATGRDMTGAPSPDLAPPACGSDPWITFGHDSARSSATDACISGPLITGWRYVPGGANNVFHAIAASDAAYLQYRTPNPPYLGTTAVDRVSPGGTQVWSFATSTDTNMGNWPALALGAVILNDDGLYVLDRDTGALMASSGVDWWGQIAPDAARLYAVNNAHIDGPDLLVGAFDASASGIWTQYNSTSTHCRIDAADLDGAIALDGGNLFQAARYVAGSGVTLDFDSGVYAFDAATGSGLWSQATTPRSALSAGAGQVYLVEDPNLLVARAQSDGQVVWWVPVTGVGPQAPVLAAGLVIVGTFSGVAAFDAASGGPRWSASLSGGAAGSTYTQSFSGGCAGPLSEGGAVRTTLAAALGSNTLVVTAGDGIHILSLDDGSERWSGAVDQAVGAVHDPILVGNTVYVIDSGGLLSLTSP